MFGIEMVHLEIGGDERVQPHLWVLSAIAQVVGGGPAVGRWFKRHPQDDLEIVGVLLGIEHEHRKVAKEGAPLPDDEHAVESPSIT
jgi:hypothetical protein